MSLAVKSHMSSSDANLPASTETSQPDGDALLLEQFNAFTGVNSAYNIQVKELQSQFLRIIVPG
jgi:hypothetical protein